MLNMLLNVFGGLAIFIFGMTTMSEGLHQAAGEKMRSVLRFFSSNCFIAILSGTLVTTVIQSSSASTVMVIGFVNAGLLNLVQAIGIIFGANIGTTITAQLVAFEISWIIMPSIILGLLVSFIRNPAIRGWGMTVLGFGFLFLGMTVMSDELKVLSNNPDFVRIFSKFDSSPVNGWIPPGPLFGAIFIGLAATLVIQSSSACTGIIIALGAGGIINLYTAVALVLGSNIGTTITAQLAAIPGNRIAKQAALAHTLFNVIGVMVMVSTFWIRVGDGQTPIFFAFINYLSGNGDLPRHIANAHTIFNVCTTLILIPFIPLLAKVCEKVIPQTSAKVKFNRLEPNLLATPSIALDQTTATLQHMLKKAWKMIECALNTYNHNTESNRDMVKQLPKREERIDELQQEITNYLSLLMQQTGLSPHQASTIPRLLHCTNDVERIGDHTEIIVSLIRQFKNDGSKLSRTAEQELEILRSALTRQSECALSLLTKLDRNELKRSEELRQFVIDMTDQYEANHIKRLGDGRCTALTGIFYIELLSEIRKVSRHLANITERAGQLEEIAA